MVSEMVVGVYSSDLEQSKGFYVELLQLVPTFESDWVIQLTSRANENLNLTLQLRTHESIPKEYRKKPQGFSIAFVVPDVDSVYKKARTMNLEIIQAPKDEDYGQRRFLTLDPDGLLVDVSTDCESSAEFVRKYLS